MGMPALSRRLREWTVVAAALVISGLAYTLFPFVVQVSLLMALSFLLGIGLGSAQPMIMALLYAASPPGRQGEVVGLRSTALGMSTTITPLAYGAAGSAFGIGPVLWVMAGLLLAAGWLAARRS